MQLCSSVPPAQQVCRRERIASPVPRVVYVLSPLTTFPFLRSVSVGENRVPELRIQRQAQLLVDHPMLQNVDFALATTGINCY